MTKFRRIFWNVRESFMGIKFFTSAPIKAVPLILMVALPIQTFLTLQKGNHKE